MNSNRRRLRTLTTQATRIAFWGLLTARPVWAETTSSGPASPEALSWAARVEVADSSGQTLRTVNGTVLPEGVVVQTSALAGASAARVRTRGGEEWESTAVAGTHPMLGLSLLELPEPPSAVVRPDRGSYLARTRVLLINGPGVGPDSVSARIYRNFQLRDFPDLCPVDAQVTGAAPVVDSTWRFLGVACDLSSGPDQFGYVVPAVSVGVLAQSRLTRPIALSDFTRSPAPGFETDSTASGLLFRGAALIQIGRFEAAEHYLRRAEKQDGSMLEIYQWLGRALFGREQYRPAVEEFLYVAERDTANHWAWHMAGAASHQAKDYAAAETLYKRALRVNPKAADTYCNLGGTYSVLGRRAEAEAAWRTSIQIDPRSQEGLAHFNLASALHHAGREAGVDSVYRALLELDPAWADRLRASMKGGHH